MTTIAFSRKHHQVAADRQVTGAGDYRVGHATKIFKVGRIIVGGTGTYPLVLKFTSWVRNGCKGEAPWMAFGTGNDSANATGIIFSPGHPVLSFTDCGMQAQQSDFGAFGSGRDFALGALAMGASPKEAVRIAARLDIYTGIEHGCDVLDLRI